MVDGRGLWKRQVFKVDAVLWSMLANNVNSGYLWSPELLS